MKQDRGPRSQRRELSDERTVERWLGGVVEFLERLGVREVREPQPAL